MKKKTKFLLSCDFKDNKQKFKIFLLFFVVLSTIIIHIVAINNSSHGREVIWETDDNYHEIVKAKNLNTCVKNCLAVNNLSLSKKESLNGEQQYLLQILLHHTGIEYHFIKTKILEIFNSFLNDWELSQIYIAQIVTVLLVILFSTFILIHFNLNICVIASIIIFPYVTIKYGFHFSNGSSDLASVFGILSLICLSKLKIQNYLISMLFSSVAIFTHPVGVFMIIFNSIFIIVKNKLTIDKNLIIYLLLGIIIVSFYLYLDLNYIDENIVIFSIYNNDLNILNLIKENFKSNLYFFYDVFNLLNFALLFILIFTLFGNYKILIKKYSNLLPIFFSFLGIIIISFFHYAPEASIITRMQHFLTLSLLSIYSILVYEFLLKIKNYKYRVFYLLISLLFFCGQSYYNFSNLFLKIRSNQETLNLNFNTNLIKHLQKKDENKYIIFKKNNSDLSVFKSIYYKFLIEGFNEKNVFVSDLITEDQRNNILNQNFYLILPSPIINNNLIYKDKKPDCLNFNFIYKCIQRGWYGESRANMSDLLVRNGDLIEVKSVNEIDKLFININTYGNKAILTDNESVYEVFISNNSFEWIELSSKNFDLHKFKLYLPENKFIKIKGIKSTKYSYYNWPWNEEISVEHTDQRNKRVFYFNIEEMIGDYYCKDYNIVDDKSSFVVVDIKCKK